MDATSCGVTAAARSSVASARDTPASSRHTARSRRNIGSRPQLRRAPAARRQSSDPAEPTCLSSPTRAGGARRWEEASSRATSHAGAGGTCGRPKPAATAADAGGAASGLGAVVLSRRASPSPVPRGAGSSAAVPWGARAARDCSAWLLASLPASASWSATAVAAAAAAHLAEAVTDSTSRCSASADASVEARSSTARSRSDAPPSAAASASG
mmetsp:Transcript_4490/g.19105  ORF Transcript_4490/g.19105 Transcript_4490/m.19105 type:complete len:213 (+) Transcript_4490:2417-3055(+)